ncbi:putative glutamate/phenylalanine/leucine/valine dehydrogenase [Plasmopara halstedii]
MQVLLRLKMNYRCRALTHPRWRPHVQTLKRLIVESANLFVTPEACQLLFDNANLVIVKDSLANKYGFLEVKDELVIVVDDKLRALDHVEFQLLFCYQKKESTLAIPPASVCINRAIIRMHDTMVAHFGDIFEKTSTFGSFDRVTFTAQNL